MRKLFDQLRAVLRSRAGRTMAWSLINLPMAIIVGMITARALGVSLRGTLAIVLSVAGISVLIGALGTNVAIRRRLPGNKSNVREYLTVSLVLWVAYLGLTQLVAFALARWIDPAFHEIPVLMAFTLYGAAFFWSNQLLDLLNAVGKVPLSAACNTLGTAICLVGVVGTSLLNLGFLGIAGSYIVSMAAQAALAAYFLRANRPPQRSGEGTRRLLSDGVRLVGLNLGQAVTFQANPVILGALTSAHAVGIYAVATTPAAVMSLPATAVGQVLMHDAATGRITAGHVLKRVAQMEALLAILALVGWLVADFVVNALFGPAFAAAADVFRVLLIGQLALAPFLVVSKVVVAFGARWSASVSSALGATLLIVLGGLIIPHLGVLGAAWASVVAYLVMSLVSVAQMIHISRKRPLGGHE